VLRDILLSEVENETTGIFNEGSQSGSSSEKREKQIKVVENRRREKTSGTNKNSKSNEQSGNEGKGISYIKSDETQTFSAWGKWSRNDITAAINEGCVVRKLDSGICYITGKTSKGLSDKLQSRLSELRNKDVDRVGWEQPLQQEGFRSKEGRETGFFRVESFEVLEQGCDELDKYRDESGSLYFYDLEIERHPSFTINEGL